MGIVDTPPSGNPATLPTAALTAIGEDLVRVQQLEMAYGSGSHRRTVLQDINFTVRRGEVLVLMGPSGCGKSTLMRAMVGLNEPAGGQVIYTDGQREDDLYAADEAARNHWRRRFGVMFQGGALWSAMSVGENVMMPMSLFTAWSEAEQRARAQDKLAQVGLGTQFDAEVAALSGGMKKRAAIARAMALDPPLLFLDEPSAGLDPVTSARLDELIQRLRTDQGTAIVMVTHELDSLMAIADRALYLDPETRTQLALDAPQRLRESGPETVRRFLRRQA